MTEESASQSASHPDGARLDAVAIGLRDEETAKHVAICPTCTRYVDALKSGAEEFARQEAPRAEEFVRAVRRRERTQSQRGRVAWTAWTGGIASALALAAGLAVFVRSQAVHPGGGGPTIIDTEPEGPVRFKGGGTQVATVVDRGGAQSRQSGDLTLEPGDRIRLEIALDHEERITAGVLAESGDWAELEPPALLSPGTHYSEQSVTFEHEVPSGWILVGGEDAVSQARQTRDFGAITSIRVRPKQP